MVWKNCMKNLDFRVKGELDSSLVVQYRDIYINIRKEYVDCINRASNGQAKNLVWWFGGGSSRDDGTSNIYHYMVCALLLREILNKDCRINTILVDDTVFKKVLLETFPDLLDHNIKIIACERATYQVLVKLFRPVYIVLRGLLEFSMAKIYVNKIKLSRKTTIISTYVQPTVDIDDDRYFPGLLENTTENVSYFYFVPRFHGYNIFEYKKVYQAMHKSKKKWLVKEKYLKISDYFFAFFCSLKVTKNKIPKVEFFGISIDRLLKYESNQHRDFRSTFNAWLNFRFFMRLSQDGIVIKRIISWHENNLVDKGWNAGINKFFPDVLNIGYQGFARQPYINYLYSTHIERRAGIIPNIVAVIGDKDIEERREFDRGLSVVSSPAFRFQHIWRDCQSKNKKDRDAYHILIALPERKDVANEMISMLNLATPILNKIGVKCVIKIHPDSNNDTYMRKIYKIKLQEIELSDKSIGKLLCNADLLISAASSVCLEAIVTGVYVALYESGSYAFLNLIPPEIDSCHWKGFHDASELEGIIKHHISNKISYDNLNNLKEQYFIQVNQDTVATFLNNSVPHS